MRTLQWGTGVQQGLKVPNVIGMKKADMASLTINPQKLYRNDGGIWSATSLFGNDLVNAAFIFRK